MVSSITEIQRSDLANENVAEEMPRKKNKRHTNQKMDTKSGPEECFRTHENQNQ